MKRYFVYVKIKVYPWDDWFLTGFYMDNKGGSDLYSSMIEESNNMFGMCHAHEVYGYSEDKKIVD